MHEVASNGICYLFPDKIPFSAGDGKAFAVADYGCRDSGASVPLIRHLIGVVFTANAKLYRNLLVLVFFRLFVGILFMYSFKR